MRACTLSWDRLGRGVLGDQFLDACIDGGGALFSQLIGEGGDGEVEGFSEGGTAC